MSLPLFGEIKMAKAEEAKKTTEKPVKKPVKKDPVDSLANYRVSRGR